MRSREEMATFRITAYNMHKNGMTLAEIGKIFGCSKQYVSKEIKKTLLGISHNTSDNYLLGEFLYYAGCHTTLAVKTYVYLINRYGANITRSSLAKIPVRDLTPSGLFGYDQRDYDHLTREIVYTAEGFTWGMLALMTAVIMEWDYMEENEVLPYKRMAKSTLVVLTSAKLIEHITYLYNYIDGLLSENKELKKTIENMSRTATLLDDDLK